MMGMCIFVSCRRCMLVGAPLGMLDAAVLDRLETGRAPFGIRVPCHSAFSAPPATPCAKAGRIFAWKKLFFLVSLDARSVSTRT